MSLIVDANVAPLVFSPKPDDDFQPVRAALIKKRIVAVRGGKLSREYLRLARFQGIFNELDRQGTLRAVSDSAVDDMTRTVEREGRCVSDDPHIIALARVSGARLLCSGDVRLHADFKNRDVLEPAGSVYQNSSHRRLLEKHIRSIGPADRFPTGQDPRD